MLFGRVDVKRFKEKYMNGDRDQIAVSNTVPDSETKVNFVKKIRSTPVANYSRDSIDVSQTSSVDLDRINVNLN